ncbi:hypothetical protein TraAM80_04147 [Trypanosoma rangeli]|uniref:Trichohyalin-plectin-homology domain-containing protein n=1 Tax=Trypanosoma rangeli TaxID=5698 RepID=A0A3R7MPR3_TRYRA|nr:uncharacterized protein TraAM80_04147 [Trypanosoma rangeli]RNF06271.1 hypothetical protein TraAM80_04147 [Trypanosoma rangeli]|eukprot:RNF06271.1 hypothetical protein TraAM80_04147 [Trypanosoma rangeli]
MSATAASFPVTRARVDLQRKVGLANAVAQGRLPCHVGIMSESDLNAIRGIANADEGAYDAYRRQEDARRREASAARTALWPDTMQAKQEKFIRRHKEAKLDEERRANLLLEMEAQLQAEERKQRQAQLALKYLKEDPRGRNVRSVTMLHEAIKDREAQIAFKNELKRQEEVNAKEEQELLQREQNRNHEREEKEKFAQRARNVEEKNSHLQQMLFQIAERKKMRAEQKEMLADVNRGAEEEIQDNLEEARVQREKIVAVHEYNRSIAQPPLTKHDRLRQRIKREEGDDAARALQDEKVDAMKRVPMERLKKKQQWFDQCKERAQLAFAKENEEMQHKERTQSVFERCGTNLMVNMAADEERRKQEALEERHRRREEFLRAANGEVEELPEGVRRAATHCAGFMNEEEAREYQKEMQTHPARVLAEQKAEAAKRREEAELLQHIHRLQASEKKENDRREAEELVEARRRQKEAMEEDDELYRAYVKSQLPSDMDPYLYAKAMNLHT